MSAQEYEEWKVYHRYEPFSFIVNEVQLASLLSLISNYMGGKKKMSDFMISKEVRKPQQVTGAELDNIIQGMF